MRADALTGVSPKKWPTYLLMIYRIKLIIDVDDHLKAYDVMADPCSKTVLGNPHLKEFCLNRPLTEILQMSFSHLLEMNPAQREEDQFLLCMEWDCLRSAIGKYLGLSSDDFDSERCQILSIEHHSERIVVEGVLLPPKDWPNSFRKSSDCC